MASIVTLEVIEGPLKGKEFDFEDRNTCIMGRRKDCNPMLPDDKAHEQISRYHCLLDINPPRVRVRDFGSLNGTWVKHGGSGDTFEKIGQRARDQDIREAQKQSHPEHDLEDGDEIKLANTVFKVTIGEELDDEIVVVGDFGEDPGDLLEILSTTSAAEKAEDQGGLGGYELVKELGRGGMGVVFFAKHRETGEPAVVKTLLPQVGVQAKARDRFLRDARLAHELQHPNVARTFASGCSDEGIFYVVMEHCDGGSLKELIDRRKGEPLPLDEALQITYQALDGLAYCHQIPITIEGIDGQPETVQGLVHRDIKPSNLFFTGEGDTRTVKLVDSGISKSFDLAGLGGQTLTGGQVDTPSFMPRQQVLDLKYGEPDVDVWSLAACLYWMLTGSPPRTFDGAGDPWRVVLTSKSVPILQRNPNVPAAVAAVIDRALVDDPEIPYKSSVQLKAALLGAS